ncbi:Dephospho-CoA kinase [Usitatibacter rugosus]|uniref:Dephospho-CoA kinase n=1 Tax=Usitatibacter rugosus TaxID=2732067 RepID=A0A6M4GPR6_9PROT|nr:dephospho-CoA kinase [Usitatibacter rugosus]QJR09310.1 Dephospho-CoA kinase [Usitatibacter rugosus]
MKLSVGLTGGIGSGKSTVAERFERLGASLVDADEISRALTAPGGAAMPALRAAFGRGLVAADGALDRRAMRELAFTDPGARARLEAILHPLVRAESDRARAGAGGHYVMMIVPLLFETGGQARVDRTLVVDAPEETQVERVVRRSALAPEEVRQVMAAQWPRWRRLQAADDVVFNGGSEGELDAQCERLHARYAELARERA